MMSLDDDRNKRYLFPVATVPGPDTRHPTWAYSCQQYCKWIIGETFSTFKVPQVTLDPFLRNSNSPLSRFLLYYLLLFLMCQNTEHKEVYLISEFDIFLVVKLHYPNNHIIYVFFLQKVALQNCKLFL